MISLALLDHISIIMTALAQEMMIALLAWLDAILQLGVQVIRSLPSHLSLPRMMTTMMTDHPSHPTSTIIMTTTTTKEMMTISTTLVRSLISLMKSKSLGKDIVIPTTSLVTSTSVLNFTTNTARPIC